MTDRQMDRWTDRWTNGQTNGRTDGGKYNNPFAFLKKRGDNNSQAP